MKTSTESPFDLLREILEKDRAAIAEMKENAPWYSVSDEVLDLHRRIELCLSANTGLADGGSVCDTRTTNTYEQRE